MVSKIDGVFTCYGFYSLAQADHSILFYRNHNTLLFLFIYVDDIIVIGNSKDCVQWFYDNLAKVFPVQNLGPALSYFFGVQVTCGDDCLFISVSIQVYS